MSVLGVAKRLGVTACFATLVACAGGGKEQDGASATSVTPRGYVGFALTLAGGAPISAAHYELTGRSIEPIHGAIQIAPTGEPSSLAVSSLPAGQNYALTLSATGADGSPCNGSARFDVLAGRALELTVPIYCRTAIAAQ